MSDIVESKGKGVVALMNNKVGGLIIPKPFERDIFLCDSLVAGTTYIEGIEELEPHLHIGERLNLFREPDNEYDDKAIVIKNADGVKIGYVRRNDNIILSHLMDAGKLLYAEITNKEMMGYWLKLEIKIYLHEE